MTNGGMEIDRTQSGKIKINVVSLANLAVIVGLLITAISTWNGLVGRVDNAIYRVEALSKDLVNIRTDMNVGLSTRDSDARELRARMETVNIRLTVVESQLTTANKSLEQLIAR